MRSILYAIVLLAVAYVVIDLSRACERTETVERKSHLQLGKWRTKQTVTLDTTTQKVVHDTTIKRVVKWRTVRDTVENVVYKLSADTFTVLGVTIAIRDTAKQDSVIRLIAVTAIDSTKFITKTIVRDSVRVDTLYITNTVKPRRRILEKVAAGALLFGLGVVMGDR